MDQGTTPAAPSAADHTGAVIDQDRFSAVVGRIVESVERVIDGKRSAIDAALVCLFAEGHLLIEDVPGVGKTMLARALAASVHADVRRIQFTPDLLPGDVTGVSVFNPVTREFEFKPGAIFANVVIADEINRASPKTQSALLEAMEERQVTVDGLSRPLPAPFIVVATQNPLEMDGTYALPEAQRDRFLVRLSMGYPDAQAEQAMIRQRDAGNPLADLRPVTDAAEITAMIRFVRGIHVSPLIEEYVVRLAQATRTHPDLRLGASPRATLQLVRAAKVWAALDGRDFVLPDDVTDLLSPVFAHRLLPTRTALGRASNDEIIDEVLSGLTRRVAVPIASRR
ncbi:MULTISPECIES: MoxR family ATPase [Microbacterium]|jgi:MoxR-like ATPase|uniref:AAA family ATPase n=1 Tax=Microbacterium TaxID=33882 RepID=UPI001E363235|nr:MoxR family ATPase [Microbacterium nymphoidis]MCD2498957.1 MoxR family ATPase [Microbacterium nymphoidis]